MYKNFLKNIMNSCDIGYALCEVIYDNDIPVDFKLLEINPRFLDVLGIENKEDGKLTFLNAKNLLYPEKLINNCLSQILKQKDEIFNVFVNNLAATQSIKFVYGDSNNFSLVIDTLNYNENLLLENDFYYEKMIRNMNDIIWIMKPDLTFIYVSPSVKNVLGYNERELVGKKLDEIISKDSYKNVLEEYEIAKADNSKANIMIEINQSHTNGSIIKMEYMVNLLWDNDEVAGIMGVGRDITLWSDAKEELRESKESLALLLNSTAEGIFGLDKKGYITFVNKSCLKLLDYKNKYELINKHAKVIMGIDNDERFFLDRFESVFEKGIGHYFEVDQFVRKDGSNFISEYYIYPQLVDGEIIGSVVTFFDITDRVKIENELYESERSKAVLIANLPGLAYRCNFDDEYTFKFASDGCYELTGYLPESFIDNRDLSFNDIIVEEYRAPLRERWQELIGTNNILKEEYEIICKDGSRKWVLEKGQIIYDDYNNVIALEGIIIDINEQKLKQKENEYLTYYDSLTGIKNRISYDKAKAKYYKKKYLPLSLIIGDINGLKLINDTVGHSEGDDLIIKAASLLSDVVDENYFLARTSGDEFSILLPNTDSDEAYLVMRNIIERIDEYNQSITNELKKVNLALGFATLESLDQNFSQISKVAEEYMYKRKLNDRTSSHSNIIAYIKSTMYERSRITEEHAERLKEYSQMMGTALKLSQVELDELALVSTLHDIGKIGIDDAILNKTGKLTNYEWQEMKKHPEIGYRICMASPELMSIAPYVLSHHERWDGSGYPEGLKGNEIPLLARIIAIVDAYDAMTEDRPYRKALSKEKALKEIKQHSGTQFDPELANIFLELMSEN